MGILDDVNKRQAELDALEAQARASLSDSSMAAMLRSGRKAVSWVIPDLLPVGLGLIVGKPKAGKSFLALDLAVSVWLGEMPFGQAGELAPADVLYINLEETEELVMERVDAMGVVGGPCNGAAVDVTWRWRSDMSPEGPIVDLREWLIERRGRAKLVIIDTWVKFCRFGAENLRGLNAYERDVKLLAPVQAMAREFGVAIVGTFHQKKSSKWDSDDPFETVSGSMGSIGSADCIWHLNRPSREEPEATLTVGGRAIRGERALALHFDGDTVTWLLRGAENEVVTSEMREVLHVLSESVDEGLTLAQLYGEVSAERGTIRKRLQRMRTKGLVRPVGKRPRTKWQITPTGELYIRRPPSLRNERRTRGKSPDSMGTGGVSPMCPYSANGDRVGDTPCVPYQSPQEQRDSSMGTPVTPLSSSLEYLYTSSSHEKETSAVPIAREGNAPGPTVHAEPEPPSPAVEQRLRTVVGPACEDERVRIGDFLATLEHDEWSQYLEDFESSPALVSRLIRYRLEAGALTRRD